MKLESLIRHYISNLYHLSLATSDGSIPWITEVHFAFDDGLDLYFLSRPSRRHSKEILSNPHVAGNIVKQFLIGEKVTGVYFEGRAYEITEENEKAKAYTVYQIRFDVNTSVLDEYNQPDGHRFYKIIVEKFFVYDEKELNPSGKYELFWKKL